MYLLLTNLLITFYIYIITFIYYIIYIITFYDELDNWLLFELHYFQNYFLTNQTS